MARSSDKIAGRQRSHRGASDFRPRGPGRTRHERASSAASVGYRPSIRAARGACAAVDSVCGSRPFAMPVASAAGLFARATRLGRRGAVRAGSRRRRVSRGEFHRLSRSRATGWARPVRRGRHWRAWRWRCGRPSAPSPGVAGAPDRRRAHGARPCGASYTGTPSAGRHRDERQHRRRDHAEVELGEEPVDRRPYAYLCGATRSSCNRHVPVWTSVPSASTISSPGRDRTARKRIRCLVRRRCRRHSSPALSRSDRAGRTLRGPPGRPRAAPGSHRPRSPRCRARRRCTHRREAPKVEDDRAVAHRKPRSKPPVPTAADGVQRRAVARRGSNGGPDLVHGFWQDDPADMSPIAARRVEIGRELRGRRQHLVGAQPGADGERRVARGRGRF